MSCAFASPGASSCSWGSLLLRAKQHTTGHICERAAHRAARRAGGGTAAGDERLRVALHRRARLLNLRIQRAHAAQTWGSRRGGCQKIAPTLSCVYRDQCQAEGANSLFCLQYACMTAGRSPAFGRLYDLIRVQQRTERLPRLAVEVCQPSLSGSQELAWLHAMTWTCLYLAGVSTWGCCRGWAGRRRARRRHRWCCASPLWKAWAPCKQRRKRTHAQSTHLRIAT